MFTDDDLDRWASELRARLVALGTNAPARTKDRAVVELDQQMVGRLSRMDAMQQQAMAQATYQRRLAEMSRAKAALARMEEGEFGYCLECGEVIASKRLDYDPSLPTCVTCASG